MILASNLATYERTPDHVTQNTFLDQIDPSYTKSLSGGKTLRKYFQRGGLTLPFDGVLCFSAQCWENIQTSSKQSIAWDSSLEEQRGEALWIGFQQLEEIQMALLEHRLAGVAFFGVAELLIGVLSLLLVLRK